MQDPNSAFPYSLCYLVDYDGDLSKDWIIKYKVWNVDRKELVRKQVTYFNEFTTTKQKRYKIAEELMNEIDSQLKNGGHIYDKEPEIKSGLNIKSMTVIEAFKYAYSLRTQILENDSYSKSIIDKLDEWLKKTDKQNLLFVNFKKDSIYLFLDFLVIDKELANKTRNNYLGEISAVFTLFNNRYPDQIKDNQAEGIEYLKFHSGKHVPFNQDQLCLIEDECFTRINSLDSHVSARFSQFLFFIKTIYYTYTRPREELRFIKVQHIKEKTIFIPPELAKNDEGGHVVIHPDLELMFQEKNIRNYPPQYYVFTIEGKPGPVPTGYQYFYKLNRAILEACELTYDDFDMYSYKHSGVIAWFNAGADIKDIQKQCRHKDIKTTDKYLKDLGLIRQDRIHLFPNFAIKKKEGKINRFNNLAAWKQNKFEGLMILK